MFLFFMVLIGCCICVYKFFKDWHTENIRRDNARKKDKTFYIDRYGRSVDVDTNVPYRTEGPRYTGDGYTDSVRVQAVTGTVIKNYTQGMRDLVEEERRRNKSEAIKNGDRYYIYETKGHAWPGVNLGKEKFEFQINNAKLYHRIFHFSNIWADVNDDKPFFVYKFHTIKESIPVNVKVDLESGMITGIIDEELYDTHEINIISYEIDKKNKNNESLIPWCYERKWNFPDEIHCRTKGEQ